MKIDRNKRYQSFKRGDFKIAGFRKSKEQKQFPLNEIAMHQRMTKQVKMGFTATHHIICPSTFLSLPRKK